MRDAWHEQGMLVIKRDPNKLGWDIIKLIDMIGESVYGSREPE